MLFVVVVVADSWRQMMRRRRKHQPRQMTPNCVASADVVVAVIADVVVVVVVDAGVDVAALDATNAHDVADDEYADDDADAIAIETIDCDWRVFAVVGVVVEIVVVVATIVGAIVVVVVD